jgi:hypothetical protein
MLDTQLHAKVGQNKDKTKMNGDKTRRDKTEETKQGKTRQDRGETIQTAPFKSTQHNIPYTTRQGITNNCIIRSS